MTKTPDEIKRGLECCKRISLDCFVCPYAPANNVDEIVLDCRGAMLEDLSAYIQQLEAERDAAVKDIQRACGYCKYYVESIDQCINRFPCACVSGINTRWEWRGVKEEDTHEQ